MGLPVNPQAVLDDLLSLQSALALLGGPVEVVLVLFAIVLGACALIPQLERWRGRVLGVTAVVLLAGEAILVWYHFRLWQIAVVVDPLTGLTTGRVAVPLWVESEKLYVWALVLAVLGALMRKSRNDLLPGVATITAVLIAGAALLGHPFTQPVPGFLGQYMGYLEAMIGGGREAGGAFQGMESARQFYYNSWYMWVHPPLLFVSYGCFAVSFVATVKMISRRHSSFETVSYHWSRLGYLSLTFGMLLGLPWALEAWTGESWWWSGKVNMSMMMWLLYTAVLHARLYLRRRGLWRVVAGLSIVAFVTLVLTYITTYVVPGAHSYALEAGRVLASGGGPPWT